MAAARHIPRTELTLKSLYHNVRRASRHRRSGAQVEFALAPGSTETIQLVFNPIPRSKTSSAPPPFVNVTLVPGPADTQDPPTVASTTM